MGAPAGGASAGAVDLSRDNQSVVAHHTRARFTLEIQSILAKIPQSDMGQDHLLDSQVDSAQTPAPSGVQSAPDETPLLRGSVAKTGPTADVEQCSSLRTEDYVDGRMKEL